MWGEHGRQQSGSANCDIAGTAARLSVFQGSSPHSQCYFCALRYMSLYVLTSWGTSCMRLACYVLHLPAPFTDTAVASVLPLPLCPLFTVTALCTGYPPDPEYGIMFCPDDGSTGTWPQGTVCRSECKYGIQSSDQKPFAVCQSNGQWSDIVGICKAPCDLPPLLCPESWPGDGNITASGNRTAASYGTNGTLGT